MNPKRKKIEMQPLGVIPNRVLPVKVKFNGRPGTDQSNEDSSVDGAVVETTHVNDYQE